MRLMWIELGLQWNPTTWELLSSFLTAVNKTPKIRKLSLIINSSDLPAWNADLPSCNQTYQHGMQIYRHAMQTYRHAMQTYQYGAVPEVYSKSAL